MVLLMRCYLSKMWKTLQTVQLPWAAFLQNLQFGKLEASQVVVTVKMELRTEAVMVESELHET